MPSFNKKSVENSTATVTALIPKIGYKRASELIQKAKNESLSIKEVAVKNGFVTDEDFEKLISPEAVCRLGN